MKNKNECWGKGINHFLPGVCDVHSLSVSRESNTNKKGYEGKMRLPVLRLNTGF